MKIGIYGSTGMIGSRILQEALRREHEVTAFMRDVSRVPDAKEPSVSYEVSDIMKASSIAAAIMGQDVVISAYGPGRGNDPAPLLIATRALIEAFEKHPNVRLLAVGGAGSLEVEPGKTMIDSGMIPQEWLATPIAHREAKELYLKNTTVNWTVFSPAGVIQPGERTGKFKLGGNQLIRDAEGKSTISCEDYAIAMLDEAETPAHKHQRFTIGY